MLPAIKNGDRLLFSSDISNLTRGDIILFKYPNDPTKFYIKRIVGLPSEKISTRDRKVFINGNLLEEDYVDDATNQREWPKQSFMVKADSYFVLGDNRDSSSDSRFWGLVKRELIVSKYIGKN